MSDALLCGLCQNAFSVARLRHRCRQCESTICGSCSQSKVRLVAGGEKVRVCDNCSNKHRINRTEQLEEAVDVQVQINESLKQLLKEKFEEIERTKKILIDIVAKEQLLQEKEFSGDCSRINFTDLVTFVSERVTDLKTKSEQLAATITSETESQSQRRRNLGFLQERTLKAEKDAVRASELSSQRDRLKETYRLQSITVRSLQDRVDMVESTFRSPRSNLEAPMDILRDQDEFIGDRLVRKLFPCL